MRLNYLTRFCSTIIRLFLIIIFCSCDKEDVIVLGEKYQGGIIFYIDKTGEHGLIAAPKDQGYVQWGCTLSNIPGADGSGIGTGIQNTIDIINDCAENNTAAYICANLNLNGYDDWFLPSKDELSLMYQNLKKKNIGDFLSVVPLFEWYDAIYWSSTEFVSPNGYSEIVSAWNQNFKTGLQMNGYSKNNSCYVRAIRAF